MRIVRAVAGLTAALLLALPVMAEDEEFVGDLEAALPAAAQVGEDLPCESAILVEQSTGKVLFEKNADVPQAPASITKIMTLLLIAEALDEGIIKLDDVVTCSEHASSMGGSQIWFEVGEQMTVDELIRACAIGSANDAAGALAEHLSGTEESFVARMNERAAELGMTNTVFKNTTGLDEPGHVTSARDIALMSAELLRHPNMIVYTSTWMDELRGGETELVNTNRLVRHYQGANGLKTGTTDDAGCCISASAERDGLTLIAVILNAPNSDTRFASARGLLDYGFANYTALPTPPPQPALGTVAVRKGLAREVALKAQAPKIILVEKGAVKRLEQKQELVESLEAPVAPNTVVGTISILLDGEVISEYSVVAANEVGRINFLSAMGLICRELTRLGKAA
jgi:D-alanyl-D-alanine carboxypeptidase (penicillin-binding protein 5/6)